MSDITVTETDGGRVFEVHPGDRIQIRLEEIGGTAYSWKLTTVNASVVSYDASADEYSPPASGAMGGAGVRTMLFKAIGTGKTRLELQLADRYAPQEVSKQLAIDLEVSES